MIFARKYTIILLLVTVLCCGLKTFCIVFEEDFTENEINLLSYLINEMRTNVMPAARDMGRMIWDAEIGEIAKDYANYCPHFCNFSYPEFGQICIITRKRLTIQQFLTDVMAEGRPDFTPYGNCKAIKNCLVYSQLITSPVTKYGCARKICIQDDKSLNYEIITCYFNAITTVKDEGLPYLVGKSCTDCRYGSNHCNMDLCSYDYSKIPPGLSFPVSKPLVTPSPPSPPDVTTKLTILAPVNQTQPLSQNTSTPKLNDNSTQPIIENTVSFDDSFNVRYPHFTTLFFIIFLFSSFVLYCFCIFTH